MSWATAAGEVASAAYLLHSARRSVRADLPNPLQHVPLVRAALAGAATFALELAVRPYVPSGPVGLLATGLPALVGLAAFAFLVVGPSRALRHLARPRAAIGRLREQLSSPALLVAQEGGARRA